VSPSRSRPRGVIEAGAGLWYIGLLIMRTNHRLLLLECFVWLPISAAFGQSYTANTIAGTNRLLDGSPATSAPLRRPWGVVQDPVGNIYVADQFENRVRKEGTDGKISTVAGTGGAGFSD